MWRIRLQLGKSALLKDLVQRLRGLLPDSRDRHLRSEVRFWRRWLATEGLQWPGDYARRLDPRAPVQDYLASVIDRLPGAEVEILDVGAGPLTVVGKTHPSKTLVITATDVLAREYNALLDEFGVSPPVRTSYAEAEALRDALGSRRFDIVYAQNSLDHCANPVAAVEEMLAVTRPGGFIVLIHEENEGSKERYHALHKWDFTCEGGRFVIGGPGPHGPRSDISKLVSAQAEVECSASSGTVLVVMRKFAA
jgi:SAM-dependent methyltransferase